MVDRFPFFLDCRLYFVTWKRGKSAWIFRIFYRLYFVGVELGGIVKSIVSNASKHRESMEKACFRLTIVCGQCDKWYDV